MVVGAGGARYCTHEGSGSAATESGWYREDETSPLAGVRFFCWEKTNIVQALLRTTRRLILGVALIYCIAVIALAALWAFSPSLAWWVELSNMLAPFFFVPLVVLIPLAAWVRWRPLLGVVAALTIVGAAMFGARLLPRAAAATGGTSLRVMTFNHLFANTRVEQIVDEIRAQNADVIALQELSNPMAQALAQSLHDTYPYQYLRPFDNPQGLGIISRFPFSTTAETQNNVRGQQVTLAIGGQSLTIMNIHLGAPVIYGRKIAGIPIVTGYDASSPTRQVGRLSQLIDAIDGPLVVMGDFNTSDREPRYQQLATRLHDAFRETNWGFGFTFPDHKRFGPITIPFPVMRIDYVWSKNGVLPTAARVECHNTGADHCFVVAELQVGNTTGQ